MLTREGRRQWETYIVWFKSGLLNHNTDQWPLFFFFNREFLDPYFSVMFHPTGRHPTGVHRERGDSLAVSGNFRSTQPRFTWWVRQCEGGTSRTVTHLSANIFPVVMEELVSGTKSPFTWKSSVVPRTLKVIGENKQSFTTLGDVIN